MAETKRLAKIFSALLYGLTSVIIVFVNKILLTNYRFPSYQVVALGQILGTIFILRIAKLVNLVKFPSLDSTTPGKIFPLPLIYGLNLISGLGGTQMIKVIATKAIRISVGLMIVGSIIAAAYDLTFDEYGYLFITVNNLCTAALGVYTKQKLDTKELGKYGLMYYNSLFIAVPFLSFCIYTGEIERVIPFIKSKEMTSSVWLCFFVSCICGFILNYSLVLCTQCNSALTTTCVGPIKNLVVTYVGMFSSGDFVFHWLNFIGINISVFGSILYTMRSSSLGRRPLRSTTIPTQEAFNSGITRAARSTSTRRREFVHSTPISRDPPKQGNQSTGCIRRIVTAKQSPRPTIAFGTIVPPKPQEPRASVINPMQTPPRGKPPPFRSYPLPSGVTPARQLTIPQTPLLLKRVSVHKAEEIKKTETKPAAPLKIMVTMTSTPTKSVPNTYTHGISTMKKRLRSEKKN